MENRPGPKKNPRRGRVSSWIGTAIMVVGLFLLAALGSAYGYGWLQQRNAEIEIAAHRATLEARPTATATVEVPTPSATSEPRKTSTPTPTPVPMAAVQMEIPSVGIAAKVVEASFVNGEFPVPKFAVGHLDSSAKANQRGNGIYYGHVESISSGNVFAALDQVEVGDKIIMSTADGIYNYYVAEKKTVVSTEMAVMAETTDMRITLITCAGTFNPATKDYTHRLVVVGLFSDGGQLPPTTTTVPTNTPLPPTATPTKPPTATTTSTRTPQASVMPTKAGSLATTPTQASGIATLTRSPGQ